MLGYEQSYLSALELGSKGPPTPEFVDRLVVALKLNDDETAKLKEAVEASQRKIQIPFDASPSVYFLFHELRQQIDSLHPCQVEAMLAILRLSASMKVPDRSSIQKSRCLTVMTGAEEAPM